MIEYINNRFIWKPTTTRGMGQVFAEIELLNSFDVEQARRNNIGEDEIRRFPVRALVDTGSQYLCINENIQEVLQLPVLGRKRVLLADDQVVSCNLVGPVELRFENRDTTCRALVLPGGAEPLLGLLPLEDLDVIIDPRRMELVVNPDHPDYAIARL
jgi:clan AA aspartic protease